MIFIRKYVYVRPPYARMRVNFAIKGAARNKDSKSKLDPLAATDAHVQKLSFLSNARGDETYPCYRDGRI